MGFPSPATDYVEQRISLDERIITRPAATYFMRAGATHYREGILNGALLAQGLVDELLLYLAPKLLGQGCKGMAALGPLQNLGQALLWQFHEVTPIGPDLRVLARQPTAAVGCAAGPTTG
mgnify:CR=1 FL=1